MSLSLEILKDLKKRNDILLICLIISTIINLVGGALWTISKK